VVVEFMEGVVNIVPVPIDEPPVAAAYQFNVPEHPEAERTTLPGPHLETPGAVGGTGDGLTVMVKLVGVPGQLNTGLPPVYTGVTEMVATISELPELTAVKEGMLPVPMDGKPIPGALFVQL
jgi:hypothetical protein